MINNILLFVLGILWFIDEVETWIDLKKFGIKRELNPLARYFVKRGKVAFTLFKIATFGILVGLIKVIESIDSQIAMYFLIGIGLAYLIVDVRNYEIMKGKL
ncbi:MAG: DUF5658 family protein [Candidatus Nanoarchaeia archaeon]|jgi:hypothetical protein|nr:DUF5658 family protein [Candidatus Nanoarchaeia archaeon]|tara:strand:- start:2577 stop:2882 length:306 start_codon:yes stop_codon:yes gene_type:complete